MRWELLLSLVLAGPAVGALGRLAVPGPRPLPWWRALAAGFVGAVGGGLLTSVALGPVHRATIIVVGVLFAAMLALGSAAYRRARAATAPEA